VHEPSGCMKYQKLNSANGGKPTTWVIHTVNSGSDWNCAMPDHKRSEGCFWIVNWPDGYVSGRYCCK
jgi:hypothetical protein